jgi:hypothetical protein
MRALSIIARFVQLLAIIPVGSGILNAGSFFELLNGLAHGQPWDFAEFTGRLALFSSPTGLGVALIVALELTLRRERIRRARKLRFPEEPWLWKPKWAERRIRLSYPKEVAGWLAAFGACAFVIVPVLLWAASHMPDAHVFVYVILVLMGLILLVPMRITWLNRRWGRSELEILTLPGVIGGPFRGTVIISESFPDGTAFCVTLNCIRDRASTVDGDTSFTSAVIWQDQKILVKSLPLDRPNAVAIPCSFAIPCSCKPTSLNTIGFSPSLGRSARRFSRVRFGPSQDDEDVSIHWYLSVGMKDERDPRQVTFEIPVFRTESSSPDYREDVAVDAPYLEPVDVNAVLESLPFQREYSASGERLHLWFCRKRDFFLLLAFSLAVSLGVWAIFRYVSMPLALFAGFIPAVLALMGYWTLVTALTWKAEIEITATTTTFTVGYIWSRRRYKFGRRRAVTLECHAEFLRERGSTYCVRLVPRNGPPCDIIKRVDSKQNAVAVRNWLVKQLRKA